MFENGTRFGTYVRTAIAYFFIAVLVGLVLRALHLFDWGLDYRYLVHTHSHVALLGWVYLALIILITKAFFPKGEAMKRFRRVFLVTQVPLLGMLFTFPFQGYALYSIIFSTLFLFVSYWYAWEFFKRVKKSSSSRGSYRFIKAALFYMVFSSLGPWALGAIMATAGPGSVWYRVAIYFYLHFQYNGWMMLALVGLLFYILEEQGIPLSRKNSKGLYLTLNASVILTFFLSVLFTKPHALFYIAGGVGALLQLVVFIWLIVVLLRRRDRLKNIKSLSNHLLMGFLLLLGVKFMLQALTAFPYFAELASNTLPLVIGYLHWTFLGVVSSGLFLFLKYFRLMRFPRFFLTLYVICFLVTEALIFYKGVLMWQKLSSPFDQDLILWVFSSFFLIPVVWLLYDNRKSNHK